MADITPSRIEPLGEPAESRQENPGRKSVATPKTTTKIVPVPPVAESDEDESHQLDELA
jgi:hypothetical protein